MIAKQTVYTDGSGNAVPEGHKDAKFLLVREGHEIDDAVVKKTKGAAELISGGKAKAEPKTDPAPAAPKTAAPKKPAAVKKKK